jgi:hypothetical protein
MRPEDLHQLLQRRPFQHFRLHLSNGQYYDVTHPELAMVGRTSMLLGQPMPNFVPLTYENFAIITLLQINNIVPLPPVPTTTNGAAQ